MVVLGQSFRNSGLDLDRKILQSAQLWFAVDDEISCVTRRMSGVTRVTKLLRMTFTR